MIRHVILYKFRPTVSGKQRKKVVEMLRAMGKTIPEVLEWSIGEQSLPSKKAYDLAQVSSFENAEALDRFRNHPEHIRVRNFISEVADWVIVDYEYLLEKEG